MMVSLDSARQWYPREEFLACNADHSQIAKLKRGENSIYPSVRWAIKKALLHAGDLYSEAKKTRYSESRNLESADETPGIRRSLLQLTHRQASTPSYDRTADPALTPSRSPSDNTIDQHIRHVPGAEVDQSAHGDDTQSKSNPLNETVSQWRSGIKIGELDDTHSSTNPTESAETDVASVLFDKDDVASKLTEPTASLGAELTVSREAREETNPDPTGNEVDRNTVLKADNLSNSTKNTKSMTMDKVMESAITGGDEAKTRELLAHFYDVNCKGKDGITPLLLAARYRHESVVRLLLEQGADPRARCDNGRTTLHWVGSIPEKPISETLIDLLLGYRPPFEAPDSGGVTPLMAACQNRDLLLTTRLIRHGANIESGDKNGWRPLHFAASRGQLKIVEALLDRGANIEATTNIASATALHIAAREGHLEIVKALLDRGASIEAAGKSLERPLHIAAWRGQLEIVMALLDRGASIEAAAKSLERPLHIAAWRGQLEIVMALLDCGANIEAAGKSLERPLHIAAREGHLEIVKALLHHGANFEAADCDNLTPLHAAARAGCLETVKALVEHGANPTAREIRRSKPSGFEMKDTTSPAQKRAVRELLKEAEKMWKQSSKN